MLAPFNSTTEFALPDCVFFKCRFEQPLGLGCDELHSHSCTLELPFVVEQKRALVPRRWIL